MSAPTEEPNVLLVRGLRTDIQTANGTVRPVDDIDLHLTRGETLGIVGESGSGKSMTVSSIMRLGDERTISYTGDVVIDGVQILKASEATMRKIRGGVAATIFQDPMTSLNPVLRIGKQLTEALKLHRNLTGRAARAEAVTLLEKVGVQKAGQRLRAYPHQLSGGLRQRVMIAMALAGQPKLLIADEPTTALDVSTQAQVLNLLRELSATNDMATLLITHDMGVVAEVCSRVVVMYLGQIVEAASTEELFAHPSHPYTIGLLASIPGLDTPVDQELPTIEGSVPALDEVPSGCRFAARCPFAVAECSGVEQSLRTVAVDHTVRCARIDAVRAATAQGGTE